MGGSSLRKTYGLEKNGVRGLALDPGYLNFGDRDLVALPSHHNTILVDGNGPYPPASGDFAILILKRK